ncbi:FkbM family methyltransferase [Alteromonas sp. 76-1]|nr:FkbM family methyltransferase [Alteromonas sp. 76-1]
MGAIKFLPLKYRRAICEAMLKKDLVSTVEIIDVGSFNRASFLTQSLKKTVSLHTFDINLDENDFSDYREHHHHRVLVGASKCKKNFFLTKKRECSSFYKPNFETIKHYRHPERFDIDEVIQIDTDMLDNLIDIENNIDFVKIDTQGAELDVLKGGEKTLLNVTAVQIELSFLDIYSSAPLYFDVLKYLDDLGFMVVDTGVVSWNTSDKGNAKYHDGVAAFGDFLLVKRKFLTDSLLEQSSVRKSCHLIFILVMLGYPLVALDVVNSLSSIAPKTAAAIKKIVLQSIPNMAPHPFGRKVKPDYGDF